IDQHTDFSTNYIDGAWRVGQIDKDDNINFVPADRLLLSVSPDGKTAQPGGDEWNFIGAGAGNPVWVIPQIRTPNLPLLGVSGEDTDLGTFDRYFESDSRVQLDGPWIKLTLTGFRGPGQFSIWQTDPLGGPQFPGCPPSMVPVFQVCSSRSS